MTPEEYTQQSKAQVMRQNDAWYMRNIAHLEELVGYARTANLIGVHKAQHDFYESETARLHAKAALMERYGIEYWPRSERVEQAHAHASECLEQAHISIQHNAERERRANVIRIKEPKG